MTFVTNSDSVARTKPVPGSLANGLSNRAQYAQTAAVVCGHPLVTRLHQRAQQRWGRVEHAHLESRDHGNGSLKFAHADDLSSVIPPYSTHLEISSLTHQSKWYRDGEMII